MSRAATGEIAESNGSGRYRDYDLVRRGRISAGEWQLRVRYVLRHLDNPIALQRSPL